MNEATATSPRWRVGDPDPTLPFKDHHKPYCSEVSPDSDASCTWLDGHAEDMHVAGDGTVVVAVWPVHGRRDGQAVTLDLADDSRLAAGIATLDDAARDRLRDALRDYASAEADRLIIATIRETLAREAPEQTPVGVLFTTMEYDNGHFLTPYAEVLFDDGSVEQIDFPEIDRALTDEYGARGANFTVAVDLRPGALTKIDGDDYNDDDIHTRFGVRRPKDLYGQFTVDGIRFDNARARDTYVKLKALPEEKILYLARSDGYRLKNRMDATYRQVADEDTNPDWVTATAASFALTRGWIDQEEHDRLTR